MTYRATPGYITRDFLPLDEMRDALPLEYTHPQTKNIYPDGATLCGTATQIDELAVAICGGPHGGDSYWHWMIDYLPRVQYAPTDALLIMNDDLTQYQRDTLAIYAPGRELYRKPASAHLVCSDLYVPPFQGRTGEVARSTVEFLRGHGLGMPWARAPELIYLSRWGIAARADMFDEIEVHSALASRGFTLIKPHLFTFVQQVVYMSRARVIVVPHGGAMANLPFAPSGARVIEIATKPDHAAGPNMSAACGHYHTQVMPNDINTLLGAL